MAAKYEYFGLLLCFAVFMACFHIEKQTAKLLSNYTLCCKQQLVGGILLGETRLRCGWY